MDSINSDLDLLESLSKKISDLLYNNEFSKISEMDIQRKALIKKIKESQLKKNNIKARIGQLLQNNNYMVRSTEKKLSKLSKKISDLLYNNEFSQISEIDIERKALIKKIKQSNLNKNNIKSRISELLENNNSMVRSTEKKLYKLSKNHNNFSKRLKAYSFNK